MAQCYTHHGARSSTCVLIPNMCIPTVYYETHCTIDTCCEELQCRGWSYNIIWMVLSCVCDQISVCMICQPFDMCYSVCTVYSKTCLVSTWFSTYPRIVSTWFSTYPRIVSTWFSTYPWIVSTWFSTYPWIVSTWFSTYPWIVSTWFSTYPWIVVPGLVHTPG